MALIDYKVKDEQRGKVSKETVVQLQWGSEMQRLFYQRFIEKIGHRGELRSWQFRAQALVRANQRIMACEMFTIRGLEYCHTVFPVTCQFPCSAVHCVLATLNWLPVLKNVFPKIDTSRQKWANFFYTLFQNSP